MIIELLTPAIIISVLASMIKYSTPILLSASGEAITQRSGILNLGVEGTMLTGSFVGFAVAYTSGSLWVGALVAMISGGVVGVVLAFLATTLNRDQVVASLSINLLAAGMTQYANRTVFKGFTISAPPYVTVFDRIKIPLLSKIPYIGEILFNQQPLTYLAFVAVLLVWLLLYKTHHGLIIRSVGENPRSAELQGIRVNRYQYFSVIVGSMLTALGGSFLTLGASSRFLPNITQGRGWLVIVILIAGGWNPFYIMLVALLFGLIDALQFQLQGFGLQVPYQLLLSLPYIIAILVMVFSKARSTAPKNLGIPYSRE